MTLDLDSPVNQLTVDHQLGVDVQVYAFRGDRPVTMINVVFESASRVVVTTRYERFDRVILLAAA